METKNKSVMGEGNLLRDPGNQKLVERHVERAIESAELDCESIKRTLQHAVTQYDRKQKSKPGYNFYALPQYLKRVEEIVADIDAGAPVRDAIVAGFNGRLADACLKACGLPRIAGKEQFGGPWHYVPASASRE